MIRPLVCGQRCSRKYVSYPAAAVLTRRRQFFQQHRPGHGERSSHESDDSDRAGGCLAVAARNESLRPLALALATGVNYGVAAFAVKLVTTEFGAGPERVFTNWPIYVLAVTGPAGFILNQDAFQSGRFLAPVQAIITTADPIISIGLSVLWLDARLSSGPAAVAGEVISLLVMTAGIVITARHTQQPARRNA